MDDAASWCCMGTARRVGPTTRIQVPWRFFRSGQVDGRCLHSLNTHVNTHARAHVRARQVKVLLNSTPGISSRRVEEKKK